MHKPKVTVNDSNVQPIVVITEAIESAFVQDYSNKEIIVSDDCSNDMTYERIKHFEKYNIFRYNRIERILAESLTTISCYIIYHQGNG
jgi:glycosyltransferase involved in cell wall biosynthesis